MNMKVVISILITLVIIAGAPTSVAKKQYLTSLNTVYGNGSCGTCHVNGDNDGPRTSYGTLFENQPNHSDNASAALLAIRAPPTANPTLTSNSTMTQAATVTPAVTTTLSATATPIKTTPAVTTVVSTTSTPASPGFEIVASLAGLFAWVFLVKRNR